MSIFPEWLLRISDKETSIELIDLYTCEVINPIILCTIEENINVTLIDPVINVEVMHDS